ncbi:MAG: ATP-binding protein, partial [Actinobacteria bacterium]|nr:ATP-binding protein [Actinomycetota bacterium]
YNIQGVASYLGGDITSGILATDMYRKKELTLFLDLGTNGELVVGNSEWMMGASCSAGPAFEGGGVKCGIRAVDGAIEKMSIDQKTYKCQAEVIGGGKPRGICGSGLIDVVGEMYLKGVIDRKGKFNKDIGNKYLKCVDDDCQYILVNGKNSATGEDIYISEVDIDNLIRAKAAIYAGIKTLLEEVDLSIYDLDKIYIAGGLGRHLNIRNTVIIGMLPDVDVGKYFFLGNTSVTGAYLSLLSEDKYRQSSKIAEHITYIELSVNMKFMDRYVAGLFLPYTDMKDFPTVEECLYSLDSKLKK